MNLQIDDLDRQILSILARDGRTPVNKLSEMVGLSRPSVAERLERLERDGVLLGIVGVVNPEGLGLGVTAFIAARGSSVLDAKGRRAFEALVRRDDVLEIHTVAGEDCYFIKVRTGSIEELNELVSFLTHPPLAFSTRTTIVMETHCEKTGAVVRGRKRA